MDRFRPEWLNKRDLASDPDLRTLQLRWATDDLWIRRIEVGVTIVAILAIPITVALPLLAHPENPFWYGVPPGGGAVAAVVAWGMRRARVNNASEEGGEPRMLNEEEIGDG